MVLGPNTSPLAGREGSQLTGTKIGDRLQARACLPACTEQWYTRCQAAGCITQCALPFSLTLLCPS